MKRSRLAIALGSLFTVFLVGTLGLSLAWFTTVRFVPEFENLSGSVLTSYFDRNDNATGVFGSETNPFVITTPKHWENLAKLHYAMPGFSGNDPDNPQEYYFQIGKDFNNDGSFLVYNYNDEGIKQYDPEYSAILNLGGLQVLPPLGSDANPFSNHIAGNSITIKNFTIGGEGYGDMGIFGYVGERGTCQNLYFSDFTIDASATSPITDPLHAEHASGQENHGYFGFLAGHLYDSKSFTNVYVNRCRITGTRTDSSSDATNRYGYYGHVNLDSLGGQSGIGSNYEFSLSADATHQYFTAAYENEKTKPLYTRRTEEAADSKSASRRPVLRDGYVSEYVDASNTYKFYKDDGNGAHGNPATEEEAVSYWEAPVYLGDNPATMENAVTYTLNDPVFQTTTYTLNGNSPSASGAAHNYSLSTIGTYGNPSFFQTKYFELSYKDSNGIYQPLPEMMRLVPNPDYDSTKGEEENNPEFITSGSVEKREETSITELYNNLLDLKQSTDPNATQITGEYLYYDSSEGQWKYVKLNMGKNGLSGNDIKRKLTIVFPQSNEYTDSWTIYSTTMTLQSMRLDFYLTDTQTNTFIDSSVSTNNLSNYYVAKNGRLQTNTTIYSKEMSFEIPNVSPGKYLISAELSMHIEGSYNGLFGDSGTRDYYINVGFGSSVSVASTTMNVKPQTVTIGNFSDNTVTFQSAVINGSLQNNLTTNCTPTKYQQDTSLITLKEGHSAYGIYGRELSIGGEGDSFDYRYSKIDGSSDLYTPVTTAGASVDFGDFTIASVVLDASGNASTGNLNFKTNIWIATCPDNFPDASQTITTFVADPAYNSPTNGSDPVDTNPITLSGYKAKNMDLVGGGVDFFSWQNINVIAIPGQTDNAATNPIKIPTRNEKFYATKQTPSSIVLYIKNTSNAADDANDTLGTIDFQYVTVSLGSLTIFRTSEPTFVKGGAKANNIKLADNYGTKEKNSTFVYHVNVPKLTEFGTMAASYCALDKYGNIIGRFAGGNNNISEKPTFHSFIDDENPLRLIDTYVLVLGCNASNADNDRGTWITKIDFSYKAEDGYGGTFGSVEYRDATDTATNTVFNFYLTYPAGTQATFDVKVEYVPTDETRPSTGGTYTLTISTNVQITLRYFLYYSGFTVNIVSGNNTVSNATSPGIYSATISPP
ncbi:MAG: hypothetical protein SOV58_01130 [Candidatus Enteromonas sp.]|nr:hypothetical protein [Candidatus Enteromonas sp.]